MNQIDRPHQGFDALRIQAEVETANRSQNKRPTWAPAVVLEGELLELCRELEYLGPDDKPVARLWAIFADPKRKGAVVRTTFSKHPLPGIRCRGFEMRAGMQHNGDRMTIAQMDACGSWSIGYRFRWSHSDINRMRRLADDFENEIERIQQGLKPSEPPQLSDPEEFYRWSIKRGESEESAQHSREYAQKRNAEQFARWQAREQEKQDPVYIERMREREARLQSWLEKQQQKIAKEEAKPDWRFKALTRMTELAERRLFVFVGDAEGERQRGAQVTGACCCCGKALTDKVSLERGIGPECIKNLRTFDLTDLVRLKNEMVAAHPDKGGEHEAFIKAYDRYLAAKSAAERSLAY
jgi:hypothetical protein